MSRRAARRRSLRRDLRDLAVACGIGALIGLSGLWWLAGALAWAGLGGGIGG